MIAHGAAVVRGAERSCVIVDMPFGSYQETPAAAFHNCARVMAETGCAGVKVRGRRRDGRDHRLPDRPRRPGAGSCRPDAPVGAHPPAATGPAAREKHDAERIGADAKAVADAGAFAMVIESTVESLAHEITEAVAVPTIGIGASPACDGQILVTEDLIGLFPDFTPKFVKRFAELGVQVEEAARAYAVEVRERRFPGPEQLFGLKSAKRGSG